MNVHALLVPEMFDNDMVEFNRKAPTFEVKGMILVSIDTPLSGNFRLTGS